MSGRIPQSFIDDLLARTDIIELIDGFVPLRKAGQNHLALCPFHDEKTPSFTVNQDKQFYHCFGCGANGTAITFLMEYNHMEFVEAIEDLANRAGLVVPREGADTSRKDSEVTELYELMELVVGFYRRQLKQHPQAQRAVDYLQQRGITGELAAKFELGYAPAGWDNLINDLGKSDAARQRLFKAGMIIQREKGGFYDRFRDRIIYPIRDQRGRAIGFGGRVIDDDSPKYLNSPETPVFQKGRELYGLYQARQNKKNMERLFVVEGYMDVLALVQHGIANVVATLGTAVTSDHLKQLFRHSAEIIFCFDGDDAGSKAAWRALETSLPLLRDGRQIYFRFMPAGEDPDDCIRKRGQQAFEDNSNYLPLSGYLLQELTRGFNPAIHEHKGNLIYKASPYLQKLPHGSLKQILIDKIAMLTGTDEVKIEKLVGQSGNAVNKAKIEKKPARSDRKLISQTIKLLLQQPKLALRVTGTDELEYIDSPATNFLVDLIKLIHENPDFSCARIIEHWRDTKFEKRLAELAPTGQSRYAADETVFSTSDYQQSEFMGAIKQLQENSRKKKLGVFSKVSSSHELSEEQKAMLRNLNPGARSASEN